MDGRQQRWQDWFSLGVTWNDKIINEHTRGRLKMDRIGQKVIIQVMLRWYGHVKPRDADCGLSGVGYTVARNKTGKTK